MTRAMFCALLAVCSCASTTSANMTPSASASASATANTTPTATPTLSDQLVSALLRRHGEAQRERIARGVRQVLAFWKPQEGDEQALRAFVAEWFVSEPEQLAALLDRYQVALEQVDGHFLEIGRALRSWSEVEIGPQLPIDQIFAGLDASAHISDDFFQSKLAFIALLNFPLSSLDEMLAQGKNWPRRQWAAVRLARRFALRPSGEAQAARAKAAAEADAYVAGYNVWMHHVLGPGRRRLFPKGVRLLSHWNLRDEIKADYADPEPARGLEKQRLLRMVMERIIAQTIPKVVIDDPRLDWDPTTNAVALSPAAEVETEQMKSQGKRPPQPTPSPDREPDTRYATLLAAFQAARKVDADSPLAPTEIDRRFQLDREIPEEKVRALLTSMLESPLVPRVAALIERRLRRPLEPHDLWYSGFLLRAKYPEEELSEITRKRYPTAAAFQKDIPRLLRLLGFTPERARYFADHIRVDPARGSGHALEARRRGDFPHLRTRVNPGGMDFKGFNIALHELGHNVEQVCSLYKVDNTLLQGVPNNAFTEALAFTFQNRDLEVLGLAKPDAESERLRVLNEFWATWEISAVGLVDMGVWRWMYAHPDATPAELREATLGIARELWDRYYAKVLGARGSTLLAVYSHMVNSFLYLPDYPIGHFIAFQLEQKLKGSKSGAEFERVASYGRVTPNLWMEHATGEPVSAEPLLRATEAALKVEERAQAAR